MVRLLVRWTDVKTNRHAAKGGFSLLRAEYLRVAGGRVIGGGVALNELDVKAWVRMLWIVWVWPGLTHHGMEAILSLARGLVVVLHGAHLLIVLANSERSIPPLTSRKRHATSF